MSGQVNPSSFAGRTAQAQAGASSGREQPLEWATGAGTPVDRARETARVASSPLPLSALTITTAGRAAAWRLPGPQPLSTATEGSVFRPWGTSA